MNPDDPTPAPSTEPPPPELAVAADFRLPNANAGRAYAARLEGSAGDGRPLRVTGVDLSAAPGLQFDAETLEITGTPLQAGEHRLPVAWTDGRSAFTGECLLIVNADPRSLWRSVDPPADAPYPKPHADSRYLQIASIRIAAASRRGRSHEHAGLHRDDDFFIAHDDPSGWSVLLVADGAGSAPCSREGARLAVETAGRQLAEAAAGDFGREMADALAAWTTDPEAAQQRLGTGFHYRFHAAATAAVQAIEAGAARSGAAVRDFATTLLAALVRRTDGETFVASFWLGDGAIAARGPDGAVKLMGLPDSGEYAGQTRFLDRAALQDAAFGKRVRIGRTTGDAAVLLMTDGVSDPYFETDNGLADPARWTTLWTDIAPGLADDRPDLALLAWLHFFVPGHHDDRTIAVLW